MQKSRAQFISIFLMATLAVAIMTGLDSVWFTVQNNTDAMYRATNLSDLWVTVQNPRSRSSGELGGFRASRRWRSAILPTPTPIFPASPLHVYALDDRSVLDQPELQEGRFSKSGGGAVLDGAFAEAHGLKVGDFISIRLNGVWLRLPIEGLALSSEQVYAVKNSATFGPDPALYGFVMIPAGALESAYGQKVYNQISVKTEPGTDLAQVVQRRMP